jgi:hypothetical protein
MFTMSVCRQPVALECLLRIHLLHWCQGAGCAIISSSILGCQNGGFSRYGASRFGAYLSFWCLSATIYAYPGVSPAITIGRMICNELYIEVKVFDTSKCKGWPFL